MKYHNITKDDMKNGILDFIIKSEIKNQELNLNKELKKDINKIIFFIIIKKNFVV